jgi:hypothetical protein
MMPHAALTWACATGTGEVKPMPKLAVTMMGALLVLFVPAWVAASQEATPPAQVATADPAIGDTVTYMDADGLPVAEVTVDKVQRPWDAPGGDADEPTAETEDDLEYIAAEVTVKNVLEEGPVELSDADFSLHDAAGFLWAPSVVPSTDGFDVAPLTEDVVTLQPGDSLTFLLVYEVVADEPLAHLFWQPDTGRLIALASLAGDLNPED